jgi:hypothetical protein
MPKKIDTFIYDSIDDYRKMVAPSFRPNSGGNARPEYCLTHQKMSAVKHEMTHIITFCYMKSMKPAKPKRFIYEGIAVYFSDPVLFSLETINMAFNRMNIQKCSVLDFWRNWDNSIPDDGYIYNIAGAFTDYLIKEKGLRVPEDIALIAFGHSNFCEKDGITTLEHNMKAISENAVDTLIARIQNPLLPQVKVKLPADMIVRGSEGINRQI